jgi:hypothetical protein
MRVRKQLENEVQQQRSFWLRCFLGLPSQFALLSLALCGSLHAQIDVPGPMHLTHVEGYVVNSRGKPIVDTEVTLVRDEIVAFRTRTDNAGAFHFDHVSGTYWFRVARSDYAPAAREVSVRPEIVTALQRRKLYVIVGPGACMDECSAVFSSKHEFDQAIQKANRH